MSKKNNNGKILLGLVALALLLSTPQISGMLGFGSPKSCVEAPTSDNCFCSDDENKLSFKAYWITQYFCEKKITFFNTDSPTIEQEIAAHAALKLTEMYPSCDMAECNTNNAKFEVFYGTSVYTESIGNYSLNRIANAECTDGKFIFGKVRMDLETGNILDSSCGSYNQVVTKTTSVQPASLVPNPPIADMAGKSSGREKFEFKLSASCGDNDNGIATTTVMSNEGNIDHWTISSSGHSFDYLSTKPNDLTAGDCIIILSDANSATIKCDVGCPRPPFSDARYQVFGFYTDEYYNSQHICPINGYTYKWMAGEKVYCDPLRSEYVCQNNGTWAKIAIVQSTRESICPMAA